MWVLSPPDFPLSFFLSACDALLSCSLDQPCLKVQSTLVCSLAFLTTTKISQEKQAILASWPTLST